MASPFHTTRTPSRMNDIINRDERGLIARKNYSAADLRAAIYVSPYGKGFHMVRNPSSETPYVVADGLGGGTVEPGTPVILASLNGRHGEVLISRPPAGMGGSATFAVEVPPIVTPPHVPEPVAAFTRYNFAICYNEDAHEAYILHVDAADDSSYQYLRVSRVALADMPHNSDEVETQIWELDILDQTPDLVYSMAYIGSNSFTLSYNIDNQDGNWTRNLLKISRQGNVQASVSYVCDYFPPGDPSGFQILRNNDILFCIEPEMVDEVAGGLPNENNLRLVTRLRSNLSELGSYSLPDPSTKTPFASLTGNWVAAMGIRGGGIDLYRTYKKNPTGGSDERVWVQEFDSSPSPAGTETVTAGHTVGAVPVTGISLYRSGVGIAIYDGSEINIWDGDAGLVLFQGSLDDDGAFPVNFHFDFLTNSQFVLLGSGVGYITSIVTAAGQEMP